MWTLANQLTLARIVLTPVFVVLLLSPEPALVQWALVVYAVAAITDYYDGYVARMMRSESRVGRFLDPLADKLLTVSAFVCFIYLDLIPLWMVLVVVGRDVLITALRMYAEWRGDGFVTIRAAKWKTFLQLGFIFYTLLLFAADHTRWVSETFGHLVRMLLDPVTLEFVMLLLTVFTVVTGIMYLVDNRPLLRALVRDGFRKPRHS